MAHPLLRTSGLASVPQDTTGESWARGLNQFARGIASGLEKRWAAKKEEENKFISAMDFDINSVSNDLFKGYVVDEYDKFRNNWVELFKEQKGFLTPEQKIMIQSDMNALQKSAEYLNSLSTMNDAAMLAAQKDPRVTYKAEDWEKLLRLMASDKIEPDAVREAGSMFMQSDANIPGTVLTPMNPDDAFVELAANIRKKLPKEEVGFGVEQLKEGGIRYEVPYTEFSYGSPENLVNITTGELRDSGFVNNVDKSLMGTLSDEQKKAAILKYGDVPGAFSKYYYQNLLPEDVKQEFIGVQRDYSPARRIPEETERQPVRKKQLTDYLQAEGRPLKTAFGIDSDNFVDWSSASPSVKTLDNIILDEGTEELVLSDNQTRVQPFAGAGKSQNMKIAGHDKDRGVFYLVDKRTRLEEGDSPWDPKQEVAHVVMAPEEVVIQSLTGKKPTEEMLSVKTKELPTEKALKESELQELYDRGYSKDQITKAILFLYRGGTVPTIKGAETYLEENVEPRYEAGSKFKNVPKGGF